MSSASRAASRGGGRSDTSSSGIRVTVTTPSLVKQSTLPTILPPVPNVPISLSPGPPLDFMVSTAMAAVGRYGIGGMIGLPFRETLLTHVDYGNPVMKVRAVRVVLTPPVVPIAGPDQLPGAPSPLLTHVPPLPSLPALPRSTVGATSGDVLSLRGVRGQAAGAAVVRRCGRGGRRSGAAQGPRGHSLATKARPARVIRAAGTTTVRISTHAGGLTVPWRKIHLLSVLDAGPEAAAAIPACAGMPVQSPPLGGAALAVRRVAKPRRRIGVNEQ